MIKFKIIILYHKSYHNSHHIYQYGQKYILIDRNTKYHNIKKYVKYKQLIDYKKNNLDNSCIMCLYFMAYDLNNR